MQRWVIAALFSILLICPAMPAFADGALNSQINFPALSIPLGSGSQSNKEAAKKEDEEPGVQKKKEKETQNKKIDDAIKKAWDEK